MPDKRITPRTCLDCPADISNRAHDAKRCPSCKTIVRRKRNRDYGSRPEVKARRRAYAQRPDVRARQGCYYRKPEYKERKRLEAREYRSKPEVKARQRIRNQSPEQRAIKAEYAKTARGRERQRERHRTRSARKRGQLGIVSRNIDSYLWRIQGGNCGFCGTSLDRPKAHLDHIIPLAKGGPHDDSNLQLLCATCNHRKHAKDPVAFARENGRLF